MQDGNTIETKFQTGVASKGKWTGVSVSPPSSKNIDRVGQLFVVISLSAPEEFDSKAAGDLLIQNMQDMYYEDKGDLNVISRLEKSILSTAKRLEYLLQREDVAAEEGIDLNVEAVVLSKDFVYLAVLGEGAVMLYRKGTLINLTEGLKDLSGRNLIRSGSGKYLSDDRFLLLSPEATLSISEKEIISAARDSNTDKLKSGKEEALFGVLLLHVPEEADISTEENSFISTGKKKVSDNGLSEEDGRDRFDKSEEEEIDDLYSGKEPEDEKSSRRKEASGEEKDSGKLKSEGGMKGDKRMKAAEKEGGSKFEELKDKIQNKLSDKATYQVILMKIREFGEKLFLIGKEYIWDGLLGMGKGEGEYLRGAGPKPSIRGIIILIILVVSLLYLSISGINRHQETNDKEERIEAVLAGLDEKFETGRNLGISGDIETAVQILEGALDEINQAKNENVLLDELKAKESELLEILNEVQKVIVITDDHLITDIAGYIDGGSASDITLEGAKLYIVDADKAAIYETSTDGGEVIHFINEDSSLSSPSSLVFDSEGNMMVYDRGSGILKVHMGEKRVEQLTGLSESTVGEVTAIENYKLPNEGPDILYLLKENSTEIRKISKTSTGYTMPELRLAETRITGARDMEIDGKIYVMTQSGGVVRYFESIPDPYTLVGLDKPINDSGCLELDDELVYFGDSANRRVAVVTKGTPLAVNQGKYVAQLKYRGENDYLSDIKEILVDNEFRYLYILDGTRIFKVDLTKVDEYHEAVN